MKHLSSVLLAAALVAAGVTACFKDSTSGLRNGATRIELTRNAITLLRGDSLSVQAELKDEQGNVLNAADVQWATDNGAIATVRIDAIPIPGPAFSRAFILATADTNGGVANIIVTSGGLADSVRVLVLPVGLTATAAVTGTASADTIGTTAISAGDTVVITSTNAIRFDPTLTQITLGTKRAYVFSRTPTVVKAVALAPFQGRPWVTALSYGGPTAVGNVALIDSMRASSITVSRPRYYGAITVDHDTMLVPAPAGTTFDAATAEVRFGTGTAARLFSRTASQLKVVNTGTASYTGLVTVGFVKLGATTLDSLVSAVPFTLGKGAFTGTVTQLGDTITVTAPTDLSFDAATANVAFGTATASGIVLSRTTTSLKVMSPVTYTGPITVSGIKFGLGTGTVSLATTGSYSINAAAFIGSVTTAGKYLDTVRVYAGTGFKFTTTPAASVSNVMIGGVAAFVLLRTADSMYVIAKLPNTGQIGVTYAAVGSVLIAPELKIAGNVVITAMPSGELHEPANDTPGAVAINLTGATAANPLVIYGVIDDATDVDDYFAFTLTGSKTVTVQLQFTGTGSAGTAANPDLDMYTCNAACSGGFNYAGATGAQPENLSGTFAAGTYNITVEGYSTGGTTRSYKLIVYTN